MVKIKVFDTQQLWVNKWSTDRRFVTDRYIAFWNEAE